MIRDIAVFGVGGFGREVLTLINDINAVSPSFRVIGFFDDGKEKGELIHGLPVLGSTDDINKWESELCLAVSVGNPLTKRKIVERITNPNVSYPTIIHPNVVMGSSDYCSIGRGCIICAGCVLTTDFHLGDFVVLNLCCTVGHDVIIKDYSAFMPSCNISGEVTVGECVYCGTGVKIINQTSIGEQSIIGAGAVVTKPIPPFCTAVGIPAVPIKYHNRL